MNSLTMSGVLRGMRGGVATPLALLLMLAMLIMPLPTLLLDVLFTFNIALSILVLLTSVYVMRALDFDSFPPVLLLATLMRLALNVASTRIVLLEGHTGPDAAGQVITAFGEFAVGGNYAVGIVVFIILVIINFVVITKGAGRIAEVSARFTLDALPGKQMAVDADLNAGLIDQEEARKRRAQLVQEADFYGAMDGASKFVRGDAVAALLILVINIVGGLTVGMVQHDLGFAEAAHNYTLLTIGDGLAAQIPSLLLSTATAIIISRASAEQDMGQAMFRQLLGNHRVIAITGGVIGLVALIPGMPNLAFLTLALCCVGMLYLQRRKSGAAPAPEPQEQPPPAAEEQEVGWHDVQPVDVLGLEIGYRLIPLVDRKQDGHLMKRIKGVRRKFSQELGFLIPPVHIRDNLELAPNAYRITLSGATLAEAEVYPGKEMAINPGQVFGEIEGIRGVDPAFGLESIWIDPGDRERAQALSYTVVDIGTVIATHLSNLIQRHASELLGRDEVSRLLERLAVASPTLAAELKSDALPLSLVHRVLRNLLEENIAIRDFRGIAEILADNLRHSQDADALTALARMALARSIVQQLCGNEEEISALALDPQMERILLEAWKNGTAGSLPLDPGLAHRLREQIAQAVHQQEIAGVTPVLLAPPEIRQMLARFVRHTLSGLSVLAYNEVPPQKRIRVVSLIAPVGVSA